jgi:hypothetical protein
MVHIEARGMETGYKQIFVSEVPLDGLRIAGTVTGQAGESGQEQIELQIPKGTTLHIPLDKYRPVRPIVGRIDNDTLVRLLGESTAVVFPSGVEMEVEYEDGETQVFVDSKALSHLLNIYARIHGGVLSFHSELGVISVSGMLWFQEKFSAGCIRFLDTGVGKS